MSKYYLTQEDYLMHHGVKGQKWGQRQYQNEDGSLTALGREHYGYGEAKAKYDQAKRNLGNLRKVQIARNLTLGTLGHLTKRGRQLDKDAINAKKQYKEAKKEYKVAKQERDKKAVNDYEKAFDKGMKVYDKQLELRNQGNIKDADKYYAKYLKIYTNEIKPAHLNTGRNAVERLANKIKYRTNKNY